MNLNGKKQYAIEGQDGAGKHTLTGQLVDYLRNRDLEVGRVSFPRYKDTVGGRFLHDALKGPLSSTFEFSRWEPRAASIPYALDRKESLPFLKDLIAHHDVVIYDRYVSSNLVHQGGKLVNDEERIEFARWLHRLEYDFIGLPRPTQVVFLSIPFELSLARLHRRAAETGGSLDAVEVDIDYMRASHDTGLFYARHLGWEVINGLDGSRELTPREILEEVLSRIGL